jgi:hypothetical protein
MSCSEKIPALVRLFNIILKKIKRTVTNLELLPTDTTADK